MLESRGLCKCNRSNSLSSTGTEQAYCSSETKGLFLSRPPAGTGRGICFMDAEGLILSNRPSPWLWVDFYCIGRQKMSWMISSDTIKQES